MSLAGSVKRPAVLLPILLLATTACSSAPADPDQVVLELGTQDQSTFVLYADGQLVYRPLYNPSTAAIRTIFTRQLQPEAIEALLDAAEEAGVAEDGAYLGFTLGDDNPVTTISHNRDGSSTTMQIEWIGQYLGTIERPWPEREARHRANRFFARLHYLTEWLPQGSIGEPEPYEFQRMLAVSSPGSDVELADQVNWPLDDLAAAGTEIVEPRWPEPRRCQLIEGEEVDEVVRAAGNREDVNWVSNGRNFHVELRPLIEGEPGCEQFPS